MKNSFLKIMFLVLVLQGCKKREYGLNQFYSSSDTLVIRTSKQKGTGLFTWGTGSLFFNDSINLSYKPVLPKEILDIKYAQKFIDFKSENKFSVDIISGVKNGQKVFVVDENYNKNFTDDSIRVLKKINWYSIDDLIKCKFMTTNGNMVKKDSSWIKIGDHNGQFLCGRNEHLSAKFRINNEDYEIGIVATRTGDFTYTFKPVAAILSYGKTEKDTLSLGEIINLNDFFSFANQHYRFDNVSNSGEYVTLIKEDDFRSKVGTQIGMIAPDFRAISISGDTINGSNLHDKITIVANSCGCGGDKASTKAIYDIRTAYANEINVLGLDSKIDEEQEGILIDVEDEFNKDIYKKYRKEYCSRICYVIDENNRIIDKFEVTNWKLNLAKLFNK